MRSTASIGLLMVFSVTTLPLFQTAAYFLPQDIGGSGAFQGQDIMGGAAVIFKRPARVRDLVGGAASLLVVKRQPKPSRPVEVARNNPPRRPNTRTGETDVVASARVSDSDQAEAFKNQGNTFYDLGQFAQAVEAYQNALKHAPQDPVIYNNLGAAYFSLNKGTEASESFKKSISLKTDDPDAHFNLGIAYSSIDKFEEALTAFKQAVVQKPDWADAQNALGDTYLSLNRFAEAAEAYEKTVRLNQTTPQYSVILATPMIDLAKKTNR
jgi:tetratricopeptide (TPR) repeat protein